MLRRSIAWARSAKASGALRAQVDRIKALVAAGADPLDVGFSLAARSRVDQRAVICVRTRDRNCDVPLLEVVPLHREATDERQHDEREQR